MKTIFVEWLSYFGAIGFGCVWVWLVLIPGMKQLAKDDDDDDERSGD